MSHDDAYLDELDLDDPEELAATFLRKGRQRRSLTPKAAPRKPTTAPVAEPIDPVDSADEFETTYKPARFEKTWLRDSLRDFYAQEHIVDVLAQIKGGKEANVYRCRAHPLHGGGLLAAKVYRPQRFRNLSNDAVYREGRAILTSQGRPVKETDHRVMRAIGKKTAFGEQARHTSWLMHEFTTLARLHAVGVPTPAPVAASENAILMSYHGDAVMAAPTLNGVELERDEAERLAGDALRAIETMLEHGLIHGDLSAFNILYWEGAITIIDFPQVTSLHNNPQAEAILRRDVTRVCQYFTQQGVTLDSTAISDDLWRRYGALDEDDLAADLSAIQP